MKKMKEPKHISEIVDLEKLKKYILKNVGKKCKEYAVGCFACEVYRIYESLKSWSDLTKD